MSIWAASGVKSDCRSLVGSCSILEIEMYRFEQGMQTRRLCISITGQNKRPAGDVGDYVVLWHHKGFSEQCVLVHNFIKESKQRCNMRFSNVWRVYCEVRETSYCWCTGKVIFAYGTFNVHLLKLQFCTMVATMACFQRCAAPTESLSLRARHKDPTVRSANLSWFKYQRLYSHIPLIGEILWHFTIMGFS